MNQRTYLVFIYRSIIKFLPFDGNLGCGHPECCPVPVNNKLSSQAAFSPKPVISDFDQYPGLIRHQEYKVGTFRWRMVQALNEVVAGLRKLPQGRGGRLNRKAIADLLGVSKSMPGQYMDILNDYDDAIGAIPLHVAKIPAMEEWLAAKFEAGALETFDSKQISRKQFYEEFDINGVTLLRHPEIAAILVPYDERVAAGEYLPLQQREKIALLIERCSTELVRLV